MTAVGIPKTIQYLSIVLTVTFQLFSPASGEASMIHPRQCKVSIYVCDSPSPRCDRSDLGSRTKNAYGAI